MYSFIWIADSSFIKKLFLLSFSCIYLSSWILDFKKVAHFIDCFQGLLNDYIVKVNNPLQKRERTGKIFLYWLGWKCKHFNWDITEWKAAQSGFSVVRRTFSQCEPGKRVKMLYKPLQILWPFYLGNPYKLSIPAGSSFRLLTFDLKSYHLCHFPPLHISILA